ncbi:hypothetical protein [Microbacterium sp. NPDC089695]|uniref:hypothetical protein n=1 Tax=Microbacterium sp. NPDC089695 TaxID=3364198 RepID=UPI0037FA410A
MSTITPAQLSLELSVGQKRIRAVLRELYGTLSEGVTRWDLSESQADAVRSRLGRAQGALDPKSWTLEIGDTVLRREIHAAYGGQQQGGIITPRAIPDILVITSPESGARHGYDAFEGLQEDGYFLYTGEGQYGHQEFVRGNAALRDSAANGRPIRLFTKQGTSVTYVGEFTTGEPPFSIQRIPDSDGTLREGIIFKLVPVVADVVALDPMPIQPAAAVRTGSWTAPESSSYVVGAPALPAERVASRIEFALQADFGLWIEERGETPKDLALSSAGATIKPDLYVEETGWIVEAKKSPAREYVRAAIGQVLDYALLARESGRKAVPVILLPSRPVAHIEALLSELNILLVVRDDDGFAIVN